MRVNNYYSNKDFMTYVKLYNATSNGTSPDLVRSRLPDIQFGSSGLSAADLKAEADQHSLDHQKSLDATRARVNSTSTSVLSREDIAGKISSVDMAKEMADFSKQTILTQAATAQLAQANQQPQAVLELLR